jgi:glycosyltransferase involved in cell wall biosynthesis
MLVVNARFLTQPVTGVQRYAIELSVRLKQLDNTIIFVCPQNVINYDIFEKLDAKITGTKTGHLWEQIDLPHYLKKQNNPLLINLCSTAPAFYKNKIVTHHDITYIRYPQSFSLRFRLFYRLLVPIMLRRSLGLITVSEFSKSEISGYFKYPPENIHVIYNAACSEKFHISPYKNKPIKPYLLAVSSPNYHKNFSRMIEAFLINKRNDIDLYIVGRSDSNFRKQSYNKNNSSVHFLDRVTDEELVILYQNAEAFIFPSLYEGFGIPPLEAQSCGCPVIASDIPSSKEILADSALFFNPHSIYEIRDMLNMITDNRDLKDRIINKGISNTHRFSWEISANKLYSLIRVILKK